MLDWSIHLIPSKNLSFSLQTTNFAVPMSFEEFSAHTDDSLIAQYSSLSVEVLASSLILVRDGFVSKAK